MVDGVMDGPGVSKGLEVPKSPGVAVGPGVPEGPRVSRLPGVPKGEGTLQAPGVAEDPGVSDGAPFHPSSPPSHGPPIHPSGHHPQNTTCHLSVEEAYGKGSPVSVGPTKMLGNTPELQVCQCPFYDLGGGLSGSAGWHWVHPPQVPCWEPATSARLEGSSHAIYRKYEQK